MTDPYRYLSVCSGIEAFTVAVHELDFDAAAFAEIEDFPSKVLAHHYPDVPNLGDMMKIDVSKLGRIDWLVGGTPCQSFSVAGLRRGLDDDRGNLSLEYVRLAHDLAERNGLRGLLWENVPGVLSDKTNAFGCFLGALVGHDDPLLPGDRPAYGRSNKFWRWVNPKEKEPEYDEEGEPTGEYFEAAEGYHRPGWPSVGMASGPRARLAWRVLDSRHFGVAQRRRRVFLVADFGNGPDPATVLFEPRGQGRGFAAGGQAREEIAGTLANRAGGGGGLGTDMELGGGLQVAAPVSQMNSRTGNERTEADGIVTVDVAPTMRAGGNRTGGDRPPGSDVDTVETLVIYEGNAEGGNPDLPSMNASNGKKGVNNQTPLVSVFAIQERAVSENTDAGPDGIGVQSDIAYTMESRSQTQAVAFSLMPQNSGKDFKAREVDVLQPLMAGGPGRGDQGGDTIQSGPQVRRLTPEECEKLQGYQVGYTRIPGLSGWRTVGDDENPDELRAGGLEVKVNKKTGNARVNDPDGPRYKALGNSFTTEPVNWIMCRVQASLRGETMPPWQPLQLWKNPPV